MSATPHRRPTILLTGFEPFGGASFNPAQDIVQALNGEPIEDAQVVSAVLPCVFGASLQRLAELLALHRPRLVLALGLAEGRCEIQLERVAVNLDDARIPDNAGQQPIDLPVVPGAPAAYFSTLPVKAMVQGMRAAGFAAGLSSSAGNFVCNHVFYGLQHQLHRHQSVRSGFMHVPTVPEHAAPGQASMALEAQIKAVREALRVGWTCREELHDHSEGRID